MPALTADRKTPQRMGSNFSFPVATNTEIFQGALVALNATGFLVPGSTSTTLIPVGVAKEHVDNNPGANGDLRCEVESGVYRFNNSAAADAIALDDVGDPCFIVDDNTVALTNGGATRSRAGIIVDVDAEGVWVKIAPEFATI